MATTIKTTALCLALMAFAGSAMAEPTHGKNYQLNQNQKELKQLHKMEREELKAQHKLERKYGLDRAQERVTNENALYGNCNAMKPASGTATAEHAPS